MPPDPKTNLSLPPDCTLEHVRDAIRLYGPMLRLHKSEEHLPAEPDDFKDSCRFRWSRRWRNDKGWDKTRKAWVDGDHHGPQFHAVPWKEITDESLRMMAREPKSDDKTEKNLRPHDGNNIYGYGNPNGIFLQRGQHLGDEKSGLPPTRHNEVVAPVFIDTDYNYRYGLVRIMYWFFYELNHWGFMITHEGDWEHITQIFTVNALQNNLPPWWIYFAQHNRGILEKYNKLEKICSTHPVVFVDKNGHPCGPAVKNSNDYARWWITWGEPFRFIDKTKWRKYAGAWGEVGNTKHSTGPLGPSFKKHGDHIVFKREKGQTVVVLKP